jgi:outer membrane protein assembly factor BamB
MICSRRTLLRLGLAGVIVGARSTATAAEPVWTGPDDVDAFAVLGDEIVTVGDYVRVLDSTTGQQRLSGRLRRPSNAEGPEDITVSESTVVFGWYVWYDDVYIVCADPRSSKVEWQRRIKIVERERENIPYVYPLVTADGIFVLISNKSSENLFRLRRDNGDIVWSRHIERFAVRRALAWHGNRLLVRCRFTRGAQASGDLHSINPDTGSTMWRLRLEGHDQVSGDMTLVVDSRGYIAAPVYPGQACRLHIVDLAAGSLIKSVTIDRLGEPFAHNTGIIYFGGNTPTAWDVATERILWRADLTRHKGRLLHISDAVLDAARQRIYIGELHSSFFVLSATDGTVLGSVDVRRGATSPKMMALYGAGPMTLLRNLLLVGAGDRRLLAFATASL